MPSPLSPPRSISRRHLLFVGLLFMCWTFVGCNSWCLYPKSKTTTEQPTYEDWIDSVEDEPRQMQTRVFGESQPIPIPIEQMRAQQEAITPPPPPANASVPTIPRDVLASVNPVEPTATSQPNPQPPTEPVLHLPPDTSPQSQAPKPSPPVAPSPKTSPENAEPDPTPEPVEADPPPAKKSDEDAAATKSDEPSAEDADDAKSADIAQVSATEEVEEEAAKEKSEPKPTAKPTSQELLTETIASLREELEDASLDSSTRSRIERQLQVLEISAHSDAAASLDPAHADYVQQQLTLIHSIVASTNESQEPPSVSDTLDTARGAVASLTSHRELAVNHLTFCTSVSSFGRYTPYRQSAFRSEQEVVLYFELDHFVTERIARGYETEFHVSYFIVDEAGRRVSKQVLPVDKQTSRVERRDYFIAYLAYIPAVKPGRYTLQLTVTDAKGQKSGDATLDFRVR